MRATGAAAAVLLVVTCGVPVAYAESVGGGVSVTASEPLALLVVGAGLIGAGWIRRRLTRGRPDVGDSSHD